MTLKVNGTLERVYPTLSSDPPLSTVGIPGLLAGLDETEVEDAQQVQGDVRRLAGQGAATLAAGRHLGADGLWRKARPASG